MRAICIGEVLWDVFGDQEHLGGAPFNFAAHLKKLGHQVEFVSAIGNDILGQRVWDRMREIGLSTRYLHRDPAHATGTATVKINAAGQPQFTIHRPAAYDFAQLSEADFRHLFARSGGLDLLRHPPSDEPRRQKPDFALFCDSSGAAHKFYDLNLRQNSYDAGLIRELMARASIMKMNDEEVVTIAKLFDYAYESLREVLPRLRTEIRLGSGLRHPRLQGMFAARRRAVRRNARVCNQGCRRSGRGRRLCRRLCSRIQ